MTPPEAMILPLDLFDAHSRNPPLHEGAVVLGDFARSIDRVLLDALAAGERDAPFRHLASDGPPVW